VKTADYRHFPAAQKFATVMLKFWRGRYHSPNIRAENVAFNGRTRVGE